MWSHWDRRLAFTWLTDEYIHPVLNCPEVIFMRRLCAINLILRLVARFHINCILVDSKSIQISMIIRKLTQLGSVLASCQSHLFNSSTSSKEFISVLPKSSSVPSLLLLAIVYGKNKKKMTGVSSRQKIFFYTIGEQRGKRFSFITRILFQL